MAARYRDCLCVTLMDLYMLGERWPLILTFDIIIYSVKEKKLKNWLCREVVVKGVLQQQCLQALVFLCIFVEFCFANLPPFEKDFAQIAGVSDRIQIAPSPVSPGMRSSDRGNMESQNTPRTIMDLTMEGQEPHFSSMAEMETRDKQKKIDRSIPGLQTPKRLKDQARVTQRPQSVTAQTTGEKSSTTVTNLTMEFEEAEVTPVVVPQSMMAVNKDIYVQNQEATKPATDQDHAAQRAKTAAILERRGYKRVVEGTDEGTSAGKRPRGDIGVSQYQNLTPLISLSPKNSNNKWVSKVRVLAKGELRPFHNTRGQGSILDMDLIDQDETTRNIVFWNEDAIHFDRIINTGDTCFVSGAKIMESPKKARHPTFNKFEFKGTKFTQMQKIEDDPSIPQFKFDFTPISELCNACGNDFGYDVLGVVLQVSDIHPIKNRKTQQLSYRRQIRLVDQSRFSVNAFLWGSLAATETLALYERFKKNPEVPFIIALRNVRCTDFAHLSIQSIDKTRVFIDPLIPETASLKQWFSRLRHSRPSMGFVGATRFPPKTVTLSEIHDERRATEEASFLLSVVVSNFDMLRPQWYTACILCKKKCNKPDGSSKGEQQNYFCYACTNTSDTTTLCYNLRVKLQDDNSDLWVTVFNDTAEQLLGVKASDLATLMETDLPAYEDVYYKSRFQAINTHVIINVTPFEERDHKQFVMQSFRELDTNIDPIQDFEGIKLLMGLEENVDLDDTFY